MRARALAGVALAVCVFVVAPAAAWAESDSVEGRVAAILGPAFAKMPPWQQRLVVARYRKYEKMPENRRKKLTGKALARFLTRSHRRFDEHGLPSELKEELELLPKRVRPLAARLAILRLRQLRLDRALARVPAAQRWRMFRALFPEPFRRSAAGAAHRKLRQWVVRHAVEAVMRRVAARKDVAPDEMKRLKRTLVRKHIAREEQQVLKRVRREMRRLSRSPERARPDFFVERLDFLTPRQRELVRYALRPHDCPLIDLEFLGPRPADRADARVWQHDYQLFARLELLSEAGLPRELVLHLAPSGSPEELIRSLRAVFRTRFAER